MKKFLIKNRKRFIVVISLLLLVLALANVYFVVGVSAFANDECLWVEKDITEDSTVIFFDLVKVEGVTWKAGIRNGDKLLAINGAGVQNVLDAQFHLNQVKPGSYAEYTIEKRGKVLSTQVMVKKFFSFPHLALSLLGFFWVLIGFVVLMAKPGGLVQKLFYGIGAATVFSAVIVMFQHSFLFLQNIWGQAALLIFSYLWALGTCYTPFLLLYFFWNFPNEIKLLERKWIKTWIFIVPGILSVGLWLITILTFVLSILSVAFINSVILFIQILGFAANLTAYITLIINYRRLKTVQEKRPVRIILAAFTLSIMASVYAGLVAPAITDTIFNSPEFYAPIVLVVLFPLAFAYAIFRYQLLDVSIVVKNTLIYGTATLMLAAIYFLIIYASGQWLSQVITGAGKYQGIIAGVLFIVFALVFQSTKNKFQDFLTAKFYPEQFAYQKVLVKFSNEVATLVGLEKILDAMMDTYVKALKIHTLGILIKNEQEGAYKLVRSIGIKNTLLTVKDVPERIKTFLNEKSQTTDPLIIDRQEFLNVLPESARHLLNENIFTVIPMFIKSHISGLLLFGLKYSGAQFAGKDIDLLAASANQAAIAIENARLYKSEAEKEKLERDLELARRIQQGLLPKTIPQMKGLDISGQMIPAMQVGGDYFDFIPVPDPDHPEYYSKLFVVVGDVSGKGLPASLYMTKLQTMIQLACTSDKSPKEILSEINRKLYQSIERNCFITMTLALFDVEKKSVKFCRAGHMPIITACNGSVNSYKTKGIGIGLEKGLLFENTLIEEELQLKPRQIFAFISDGITEAMNEKKDLFGEEKLTQLLRNRNDKNSFEIMEEIRMSIDNFRGTATPSDDMTMVIVKVTDD